MMDCLVIPGKMSPSKGGVNNSLSGRKQILQLIFWHFIFVWDNAILKIQKMPNYFKVS
jgi:hypothetical protein